MRLRVLCQADVALILRRNLGPRAWEDLLADMRSDGASFHGHQLLPFAKLSREEGRVGRPVYRPCDVAQFLRKAKRDAPPPPNPGALAPIDVDIDPAVLKRPWHVRTATPGV
jgi:hypothetical protein